MSASCFDPFERAAGHPIVCDKPAVDLFEGALLENGGLGAVVTTRATKRDAPVTQMNTPCPYSE